ncbi:hypothetical protein Tco_0412227 [Tanacetum coccineum]
MESVLDHRRKLRSTDVFAPYTMSRVLDSVPRVNVEDPPAVATSIALRRCEIRREVDYGLKRKRLTGDDGGAVKEDRDPSPDVEATSDSSAPGTHVNVPTPRTGPKDVDGLPFKQLDRGAEGRVLRSSCTAPLRGEIGTVLSKGAKQNAAADVWDAERIIYNASCVGLNVGEERGYVTLRQYRKRSSGIISHGFAGLRLPLSTLGISLEVRLSHLGDVCEVAPWLVDATRALRAQPDYFSKAGVSQLQAPPRSDESLPVQSRRLCQPRDCELPGEA